MLLLCVFLIVRGNIILSVIAILLVAVYIILINLWFRTFVSDPIEGLTRFSKKIADGSYGIQENKLVSNEIGNLTDSINEMSKKIAVAEKTRTEFISQISHELRTPLTAITGWADVIDYEKDSLSPETQRGVGIISKEAERLTRMVAELLEFTRIQDGRFNLRIELIDIAAELEDALFTYGELMKQAGISLNYSCPESEIQLIPGDPERLKQVFLNLLDNASKHGGDGKQTDVSLRAEGNRVIISFRDHGHGIPENELPHVKEKFYKGSSKNRGTGIGLAVCDEIITRHNGTLTVENAEGGGCIVTVSLPMSSSI